jgi:hypothetical protein
LADQRAKTLFGFSRKGGRQDFDRTQRASFAGDGGIGAVDVTPDLGPR